MPINFVTGLPRAGKTLWTLAHVKDLAEKENRQVYTCNIPGITIEGWKEIDHPDKWMEVEDSSIIIVDELQDFWGKNAPGQKVPTPILELSKHGKRGIDFFFITQEPNLVHTTPRDLCAHHYYVVRAFGMQKAMVYKFFRMETRPHTATKKAGVEKYPWSYPTKAFTWYKSADVHNIKRKIPLKVWAIPILALFAAGMIYVSYKLLIGVGTKATANINGNPAQQIAPGQPGAPGAAPAKPQPMTTAEYVASYTPRIEGLPQTAPAYDEITKPKLVPYPAACISSKSRCKCYTQQATLLPTSDDLCRQIVDRGYFVAWDNAPNNPVQVPPGAMPVQPNGAQPVKVSQAETPWTPRF